MFFLCFFLLNLPEIWRNSKHEPDGIRLCVGPTSILEKENPKGVFTNHGAGNYNTGGEASEILPLRKGGLEKVLEMLKGGGHTILGVVFYPLKRGGGARNVLPCLDGGRGVQKVFPIV